MKATEPGSAILEKNLSGIIPIDATSLTLGTQESEWIQARLAQIFSGRPVRRVLFVAPPDGDANHFSYETCKLGRYPNFPPYGTGVIASHLRKEGVTVDILNLNNAILKACRASQSEEEFDFTQIVREKLEAKICEFQPDLIGVTCMFSQTHQSTVDVTTYIKQIVPEMPIALGGVHITNSSIDPKTREIFLKDFPHVNFFFMYESDAAFPTFIRIVNQKAPLTELSQILMNGEEVQHQITNRHTPAGENLDMIPAHDLITAPDLAENGKIGSFHSLPRPGVRFSTVLSNRGCRAQCTFCSVRNFNGVGVRGRSVQSVIDELLLLRNEFGVEHIMWLDDDFLYDHKRALQLFNEMIRQKVGVTWDCTNGVIAYSCTEEIISAAEASGCLGLHIGMESGNPTILKEIKKPGTVDIFLRAAEVLRRHEKINSRVFLMLGFPHETFRMIQDSFRVGLEMNLDWYMITPLQPLPNTPIFGQMAMEGLLGSVTFDNIRFKLGAHGNQRKATEKKVNIFATDFKNVFNEVNLDSIPTPQDINRIWAYMNYHLNFERLFREERHEKHRQMFKYLGYVADVVAPDDAFAHYFRTYLYQKVYGCVEPVFIEKLKTILNENPHWQERFEEYHLSLEDFEKENYAAG